MQKLWLILLLVSGLLFNGCGDPSPKHMGKRYQSVPEAKAKIVQQGKHKDACAICGMHLATFYRTNHAAALKDGNKRQYCSLHCVVHDNEINKTDLINLKVVDAKTLRFVPALSAHYVVGSSKPATMSNISKYAFAKKTDALSFAKAYGGKIMKFYDAYAVATKDFTRK